MNAKLKNSLIGTALILPFLALQGFHSDRDNPHQYRSGGAANEASADRTGSPIQNGATCAQCHSGGTFTQTTAAISVRNTDGQTVTTYIPGETLTVQLAIQSNGDSPSGYGGQLTVLNSNNEMAGDFTSTTSDNTQITELNSVKYLEHTTRSSTGVFTATFTAPTQGTGNITFYASGISANGNGGTSGDNAAPGQTLQLTETENETPTSLNTTDFSNEVAVFPNPSTGTFTVNLGEELSNVKTKLNTASGELIESDSYSSAEVLQLYINAPAGIYFYTIETESKSATIRLIKK